METKDPNVAPWRDRVRVQIACALLEGGPVAVTLLDGVRKELTAKQRETPMSFRFALVVQRVSDALFYVIEHGGENEPRGEATAKEGGASW